LAKTVCSTVFFNKFAGQKGQTGHSGSTTHLQQPRQFAGKSIKVAFLILNTCFGGVAENKLQIFIGGEFFNFAPLIAAGINFFQTSYNFGFFHNAAVSGDPAGKQIVTVILSGKGFRHRSGTGFDGINFAIEISFLIHPLNQCFHKTAQKNPFAELQYFNTLLSLSIHKNS
jgi:hypothetical protein